MEFASVKAKHSSVLSAEQCPTTTRPKVLSNAIDSLSNSQISERPAPRAGIGHVSAHFADIRSARPVEVELSSLGIVGIVCVDDLQAGELPIEEVRCVSNRALTEHVDC